MYMREHEKLAYECIHMYSADIVRCTNVKCYCFLYYYDV